MKILILTSETYVQFILETILNLKDTENEFLVKAYGEYDFSDDYDIGLSFMYLYKVPEEQVNNMWWINFHPGPLPKYKGRNLCYHAIMNGEKEFGASVHIMDAGFDTGPIIEVVTFPIFHYDTADDLSRDAMISSKDLFLRWVPKILGGELITPKENRPGNYYHKNPIEDFIELPEKTKREIRAITFGKFYPKINIGGIVYKIVRDE